MLFGPYSRRNNTLRAALNVVDFKKNAQHESCKLSFIAVWMQNEVRTAAWETAPQVALRDCSKETVGKVSMYEILVKGKYMQSSTYFSRRFLLVSGRFC